MPFSHLSQILYELEKKSSLVTRALSAKSCARDTDSLHSCTRLRLVQEMACLYHSCKILPRKHSYPNLIPIRILNVNCLSVSNKREHFEQLLDSTKADVIFGTESWLGSNIKDHEVFPDGYTIYRKDRNTGSKGGGVFIAVRIST